MKDKIIIALDFNSFNKARDMVDVLKDAVFFKVGLQSFLSFGDEIIDHLKNNNKQLFLDLNCQLLLKDCLRLFFDPFEFTKSNIISLLYKNLYINCRLILEDCLIKVKQYL